MEMEWDAYVAEGSYGGVDYSIRGKILRSPEAYGKKKAVVVCWPGVGLAAESLYNVAEKLREHIEQDEYAMDVILANPSLAAHSTQSKPDDRVDRNDYLRALRTVSDDIDKRYGKDSKVKKVFFGHSMHGVTSMIGNVYADSVVTYGSMLEVPNEWMIRPVLTVMSLFDRKTDVKDLVGMGGMEKESIAYFTDKMPKDPNTDYGLNPAEYPAAPLLDYTRFYDYLDISLLTTLKPITWVYGTKDKIATKYLEQARDISSRNQNFKVVPIEDAIHAMPLVNSEEFPEFAHQDDALERLAAIIYTEAEH